MTTAALDKGSLVDQEERDRVIGRMYDTLDDWSTRVALRSRESLQEEIAELRKTVERLDSELRMERVRTHSLRQQLQRLKQQSPMFANV